jgi:hypothetical protein
MHTLPDVPLTGAALFHSRAGGFPLHLCTYGLLDENGNDTTDLARLVVMRVTAVNGERFRLRDPDEIRQFLAAIGWFPDEATL